MNSTVNNNNVFIVLETNIHIFQMHKNHLVSLDEVLQMRNLRNKVISGQ